MKQLYGVLFLPCEWGLTVDLLMKTIEETDCLKDRECKAQVDSCSVAENYIRDYAEFIYCYTGNCNRERGRRNA